MDKFTLPRAKIVAKKRTFAYLGNLRATAPNTENILQNITAPLAAKLLYHVAGTQQSTRPHASSFVLCECNTALLPSCAIVRPSPTTAGCHSWGDYTEKYPLSIVYTSLHLQSCFLSIFALMSGLISCCRRYAYNATSERCFKTTPEPVELAISYIWSVGSLTMHFTLVLMFAYPLIKVALRKRTDPTGSNKESQKRMLALVRRCLILSIACIVTDVTVMLVTSYVLRGGKYSQLRHLFYNINVLLNSTLIVASFKEWKAMIFPCVEIGQYVRKMSTVGVAYTSSSQLPKENYVVSYQANVESQS